MQTGYVWIVIGVLSGALSLFSLWYGPHLLSKSEQEETNGSFIQKRLLLSEAKIKIARILEDYNREIEDLLYKSRDEARKINEDMNTRGILRSGITINSQLKRVRTFKKTGEVKEVDLKRKLEDIALELGKSNISEVWSIPELAEFKPKYEQEEATVKGAVSGMVNEVNQMANNLGVKGNFDEKEL